MAARQSTTLPLKVKPLPRKRYGRWKVLAFAYVDTIERLAFWYCECQCPLKTRRFIRGTHLRSGHTRCCGCIHGVLHIPMRDRILANVSKKPNGCWIWQAGKDKHGYGQMRVDGKARKVHRLSYEAFVGPIPDGAIILHNCPGGDNPSCCSPAHLRPGTYHDNMVDAYQKRQKPNPVGEDRCNTKLSRHDVLKIVWLCKTRKKHGLTFQKIGNLFGICKAHVSRLFRGESWRHLFPKKDPP